MTGPELQLSFRVSAAASIVFVGVHSTHTCTLTTLRGAARRGAAHGAHHVCLDTCHVCRRTVYARVYSCIPSICILASLVCRVRHRRRGTPPLSCRRGAAWRACHVLHVWHAWVHGVAGVLARLISTIGLLRATTFQQAKRPQFFFTRTRAFFFRPFTGCTAQLSPRWRPSEPSRTASRVRMRTPTHPCTHASHAPAPTHKRLLAYVCAIPRTCSCVFVITHVRTFIRACARACGCMCACMPTSMQAVLYSSGYCIQ